MEKEIGQQGGVQPVWQRIILLAVLGYEGAGCLLGGALLMATPDGRSMAMPVEIMRGTFRDFLIPGIILFGLGILTTAAFIAVLRRWRSDWIMAALAMGGLLIWFWVEIAILQALHWLHAMWGLPVVAGALATLPLIFPRQLSARKALLVCGILASLLYVAINVIVPTQWPAYDQASYTVSELSAVGAPTRALWNVLCTPYTLLMMAFAWGIVRSAGSHRRLRISGILMFAYAALGIIWPFAAMHQREVLAAGGGTFSDTMHIALAVVTEIFYLLALVFAAGALGKGFRWYSIATVATLFVFGLLTFMEAPSVSKDLPTPMIGVWERINIGVFLLWVVVLALMLWRVPGSAAKSGSHHVNA